MTKIRLPYIHEFRDRHGKRRFYFRRKDRRIPLPGIPGSAEFMEAYSAALDGDSAPKKTMPPRGSVSALVTAWYGGLDYKQLSPATRTAYRNVAERFREAHGTKPVAALQTKHILRMLAEKVETPHAANNLLRVLRSLLRFAVIEGWRRDDPTVGVKKVRASSPGFHTWTEEEIAQFEAAHPIGTTARLAMALMLFTGSRRSDVVLLGPQHIQSGCIVVRQQKTKATVRVPIHPDLQRVLDGTAINHLTFLVTSFGKPFTANGFGNAFRAWCNEAGLQQCSAHGLRKGISRRLAEAGASAHQIMAVTGHKSLSEVERYTLEANRATLAEGAIAKLRPKT